MTAATLLLLALLSGIHLVKPTSAVETLVDFLELLLCIAAGALCIGASLAGRGLARTFWALFGFASLLWAGGMTLYLASQAPLRTFSGRMLPGDLVFLVASVAFVVGCAVRPDRPRRGRRVAYDVVILAALLLHTMLYFGLAATLSGAGLTDTPPVTAKDARAALMLGCAIWLVQGSHAPWRRIYLRLAVAVLVLFGGSAVVFRAVLAGHYHPGLWDLPWTLSFLWIGIAAVEARSRAPEVEQPRYSPDWADLRHETVVAFAAILFVPALDFATSLLTAGSGPPADMALHGRIARMRVAASLGTTVLVAGLLLARQVHLLRWAERVHDERGRTLRESEERFSKAFSASPAAMTISTLDDGRYIDVNDRFLQLVGARREDVIGRTSVELGFFQAPEDRERLVREVRQGRPVREAALLVRRSSGEARNALVSLEPIQLGTVPCLLGVVEDVTERLRAEEALRRSADRLRVHNDVLVELAHRETLHGGDLRVAFREIVEAGARTLDVERASIWLYDPGRTRIRCEDLFERTAGRHSDGLELRAADHPAYFEALGRERAIRADDARVDPRTAEFRAAYLIPLGITSMLDSPIHLGGRLVGVLCHEHTGPRRVWTPEEESFAGSLTDLVALAMEASERRRAEETLKASERRYRLLFERNLAGVFRTTISGRILECNDSLVRMLGYGCREDLLSRPAWDLYFEHEDRQTEMLLLEAQGALASHETRLRRRDGTPLWVVVNETLVAPEEGDDAVVEGTLIDITERKRAEEEARRLAELKSNFLVVAAHEMRTPLTILAGYHELLLSQAGALPEEQRRSLEICHRTVQRLARTFGDILASLELVEGRTALRRAPTDLRDVAREVLRELTPFLELRKQRARVEALEPLAPVPADRERIHEAVLNLVENAIKFTPDGGHITIRLATDDGWQRLSVEDDGVGIEPDELARVWDVFYAGANPLRHTSGTYEFMARGLGLGLSITKGWVEAHGGRVLAASPGSGRGSTFTILLPSAPA